MPRLVPLLGYLTLALAWTWPLLRHLASRFAHDPGDPLLVTVLLWWNAHAVPFTTRWWNAPFFWPLAGALALTEHAAGFAIISTPVQWAGGSPLLAYNVLLIGTVWWAALATHALVKRLTGSTAAAVCAGVAFGIAPYRAGQLAHLQVLASWWMPVALLALHAYVEAGRARWLFVFGAAWLLQALSNGYYLFFFPVLLACWVLWFAPWRSHPRRVFAIAMTFLMCSIPLVPVLLKYQEVQHGLGLERSRGEMLAFSSRWSSFTHAAPLLRFWPTRPVLHQEDFLFPGFTALLTVVATWTLRTRLAARDRAFIFYGAAAVLMGWLTAGPAAEGGVAILWHPYDWIDWLPGYNGVRVPARFAMLSALCLAVAAGLGVARLMPASGPGRHALGALVLSGLLIDGWILPMPLGAPPGALGFAETGAHVLELPADEARVDVFAMYRAMTHRMPVVNGYAGYVPPHYRVLEWGLEHHQESVITELRRGHPLYLVTNPEFDWADGWARFAESLPGATLLGVSGAGQVFRLPAAPFLNDPAAGPPIPFTTTSSSASGLVLDVGDAHTVRFAEIRTNGALNRLPLTIRIEASPDARGWTVAMENEIAGAAMRGALAHPRTIPIRFLLPDVRARFLRFNTPKISADAITLFGPG